MDICFDVLLYVMVGLFEIRTWSMRKPELRLPLRFRISAHILCMRRHPRWWPCWNSDVSSCSMTFTVSYVIFLSTFSSGPFVAFHFIRLQGSLSADQRNSSLRPTICLTTLRKPWQVFSFEARGAQGFYLCRSRKYFMIERYKNKWLEQMSLCQRWCRWLLVLERRRLFLRMKNGITRNMKTSFDVRTWYKWFSCDSLSNCAAGC